MNKISASVLAGFLVLGLGACNADVSKGGAEIAPPPIVTTDSPAEFHDTGCARRTPPNVACPR